MEKDDLNQQCTIVVIGGSAGSLEVLLGIVRGIVRPAFPILAVIHRKSTSDTGLAETLAERARVQVKEAEEKELLEPGRVYVAPADYHLLIESDHSISLDYSEKVNFSRPSIDVTFESVARAYGSGAVAILLSGGSADGVQGLQAILRAGGRVVVQDPASAEIPFMPEQALAVMRVYRVLKTFEFADFINTLL